jgi:hypothetical protein
MPIILATLEAKIKRLAVQPGEIVLKTPPSPK